MRRFAVTLKHDNGKFRLIVWSFTMAGAVEIAVLCEQCPERAVINVEDVTP